MTILVHKPNSHIIEKPRSSERGFLLVNRQCPIGGKCRYSRNRHTYQDRRTA